MTKFAIERLKQILDAERTALLAGDLASIGAFTEEKTHLTDRLTAERPRDLRKLATALEHNARLLAAAREGVNSVVVMLNKQRASRVSLSSYDQRGKAKKIAPVRKETDHRF